MLWFARNLRVAEEFLVHWSAFAILFGPSLTYGALSRISSRLFLYSRSLLLHQRSLKFVKYKEVDLLYTLSDLFADSVVVAELADALECKVALLGIS